MRDASVWIGATAPLDWSDDYVELKRECSELSRLVLLFSSCLFFSLVESLVL